MDTEYNMVIAYSSLFVIAFLVFGASYLRYGEIPTPIGFLFVLLVFIAIILVIVASVKSQGRTPTYPEKD